MTDITRLDRIGIPVFASIRPDAAPGSLCVNAGKGVSSEEAEVGAYMEAIEFAYAEPRRAAAPVVIASARHVLDGATRPAAVLDFGPALGAKIDLDATLPCVVARELDNEREVLVPADCVLLPFRPWAGYGSVFGSNSNGLCSGNDLLEATVHGLAEVIERDIRSFQSIYDNSVLVRPDSLPVTIAELVDQVRAADLEISLRFSQNIFGLPYFSAVLHDAQMMSPLYVNGGYGCHPSREIAATRAICEAIQSRLSFIHGGRDDLIDRWNQFRNWTRAARENYARRVASHAARKDGAVSFEAVPDVPVDSVSSALTALRERLAAVGLRQLLHVVLSPVQCPVVVVRVLVPGLEFFNESSRRVGPRLREYAVGHC